MTATEQFVHSLARLKKSELSRLRPLAGKGLHETVEGFDLVTQLWRPLLRNPGVIPERETAWLIAKVYASRPIPHSPGKTLAEQLRRCQPTEERARRRFRQSFDELLASPIHQIEPALRWALDQIDSAGLTFDWAQLTDDLSIWERETTRLTWARQFLKPQ